jgi:type II secretory pathway pseudopilin PulG
MTGQKRKIKWFNVRAAKGFTLVETLIYLSLIGVTVSSFISFNLTISSIRNKNTAISEVQSNALTALGFVSGKLRTGKIISLPAAGEQGSSLVFRQSDAGVDLRFNVENGILYYSEGAGTEIAVTSPKVAITDMVFNNLTSGTDPANIRIAFGIGYNNPSNSLEYSYSQDYQTDINLRK